MKERKQIEDIPVGKLEGRGYLGTLRIREYRSVDRLGKIVGVGIYVAALPLISFSRSKTTKA
jgi:hypothetical protein